MTKNSQENPLPSWKFFLSQIQEVLDQQLARTPITPKQQGTDEMKEEVLFSPGAQEMKTSGYELWELSDLDDNEFFWKNPQLELATVI